MANHRLIVGSEPHIEFKPIAAVGQSPIERCDRVFRNRLDGARAAVAEKQRTTHRIQIVKQTQGTQIRCGSLRGESSANHIANTSANQTVRALIEIEVPSWPARVGCLFRL